MFFVLAPNAIYLALAVVLHLWIRHETGKLVEAQMRPLRLLAASILFAPGIFFSGHAALPGFALGALIVELHLGSGRLSWPAWQLGLTIGPMLMTWLLLYVGDRILRRRSVAPE